MVSTQKEQLKLFIKSVLLETWWEEVYNKSILDDPSFAKDSVLVPNDIKDKIANYLVKMGLATQRSKKNKKEYSYGEEKP